MDANLLKIEIEDAFDSLLELAANNDVEGLRKFVERDSSCVDKVGLWYGREKGSNKMFLKRRTPLMLAATYGCVDVLKFIISLPHVDMNQCCGAEKSTALHCAASGGSMNAVETVKLLLAAGADPNLTNVDGQCPFDVIAVSPKFEGMKYSLQMLLTADTLFEENNLRVSTDTSNLNCSPLLQSPVDGSPNSPSAIMPSPLKFNDVAASSTLEKKEYPVDPSLPDIKNSIFSTDEFRMYSFKVRPCSRAYSHDWTECPFVHPGENARRRDPRKYHYSCVTCPDFRKGTCLRGDMCEYAHGVFECWLHPAQYRTRLCKDGTGCNRRVCFFAHTQEELRPLFLSTGSAVNTPRSVTSAANAMDLAAAMSLLPGSPSSRSVMSPPYSPPVSPSINGISNTGWASQQNIPPLFLPGSNLQSSRLRSSLNARDIPPEDMMLYAELDAQQQQFLNDSSIQSQPIVNSNLLNRSARPKILTPSNLEDIFSAENSSPRYSDPSLASSVFSPTHKSAILHQYQQQQQTMLSPIKTNFSSRNVDHSLHHQLSFGASSPGRVSPRGIEPISPLNSRFSMLSQHENQHQQFQSLSSRELGSNSAAGVHPMEDAWSKWGSPNGTPEWGVTATEFGKLKKSSLELLKNDDDSDLSWVQPLVSESPILKKEKSASLVPNTEGTGIPSIDGANLSRIIEQVDPSTLGAWLEQMQIDHLMAQ